MHLNISQLNKEVQEQGPELQFRTISAAKPIEAGPSELSQQLTHTHLLQASTEIIYWGPHFSQNASAGLRESQALC